MQAPRLSTAPGIDRSPVCHVPTLCPICGGPNACRMETGEAFKGPCWCERLTVSRAALERLLGDHVAPRCLCPACLEAIAADPGVSWEALAARKHESV